MVGSDELGAIVGPITIGFLLDRTNIYVTFLTMGAVALLTVVGILFYLSIKKYPAHAC